MSFQLLVETESPKWSGNESILLSDCWGKLSLCLRSSVAIILSYSLIFFYYWLEIWNGPCVGDEYVRNLFEAGFHQCSSLSITVFLARGQQMISCSCFTSAAYNLNKNLLIVHLRSVCLSIDCCSWKQKHCHPPKSAPWYSLQHHSTGHLLWCPGRVSGWKWKDT